MDRGRLTGVTVAFACVLLAALPTGTAAARQPDTSAVRQPRRRRAPLTAATVRSASPRSTPHSTAAPRASCPRPVHARQRSCPNDRRDHPAGAARRPARQRVRLRRRWPGGGAVPAQLPVGGSGRCRADPVRVPLHRAEQHRRRVRLRPEQRRPDRHPAGTAGLWRRLPRVRRVPGPVRHGRLLEVPDPDARAIRTFQEFRWKDMPGAALPTDPATGAPWYTDEELDAVRLSSKSHWDVPIWTGRRTVHFLVSHPTPPVFDGAEDRNGRRNHDEIRFWADYLRGGCGEPLHLRRQGAARRPTSGLGVRPRR